MTTTHSAERLARARLLTRAAAACALEGEHHTAAHLVTLAEQIERDEQPTGALSAYPCTCPGSADLDICGHADSSQGCPRHDPQARADWLAELADDHTR